MMSADLTMPLLAAQQSGASKTAKLSPQQSQAIEKTAKEYEGMFVAEMLSHMFSGVEVDPMFGGGQGEEMFRSLLVQEYGKQIAQGPGLGLGNEIKRMMIELQQS
jgi:Rod binding domain-containing protein